MYNYSAYFTVGLLSMLIKEAEASCGECVPLMTVGGLLVSGAILSWLFISIYACCVMKNECCCDYETFKIEAAVVDEYKSKQKDLRKLEAQRLRGIENAAYQVREARVKANYVANFLPKAQPTCGQLEEPSGSSSVITAIAEVLNETPEPEFTKKTLLDEERIRETGTSITFEHEGDVRLQDDGTVLPPRYYGIQPPSYTAAMADSDAAISANALIGVGNLNELLYPNNRNT